MHVFLSHFSGSGGSEGISVGFRELLSPSNSTPTSPTNSEYIVCVCV